EEGLRQRLHELQKQLGKKLMFEESVLCITSLLQEHYSSSSPALRKSFYNVICRVSTVLKTRYTSPGFWSAGLKLFQEAQLLVSDESEKKHIQSCIDQSKIHLTESQEMPQSTEIRTNRGYLFEGHLTVDPEPPQPDWLLRSNLLTAAANLFQGEASGGQIPPDSTVSVEGSTDLIQELLTRFDAIVPEFLDVDSGAPKPPPASKEVVAKLPITGVTEDMLVKLGKDAVCSICQENLAVNDEIQQLPCNHMFHPPCLKPWLDEHNSCP
ncbi:hypothetical protein M569_05930, partial [Genlisea aurea]